MAAAERGERLRREIGFRLERIAELYALGDLTRGAYEAERNGLEGDVAVLRGAGVGAVALGQAAAFLRDLPAAWAATPERRNDPARLIFREVEVREDRMVAVVP